MFLYVLIPFLIALLLIVLLLSITYRKAVERLQPFLRPDLSGILDLTSTAIAQADRDGKSQSVTITQLCLQGKVDRDTLISDIEQRIISQRDEATGCLQFPEMQCYIVDFMGLKFWKREDDFSVRNHTFELHLSDASDVDQEAERLLMCNFPERYSPWDITLLHTPSGSSVAMFRMHHAVADGYASLQLFRLMTQWTSHGRVIPSTSKRSSGPAWRGLPSEIVGMTQGLMDMTLTPHPLKNPKALQQDRWRLSPWVTVDVSPLLSVKRRHGVGFSAVVYATVLGGLQRWTDGQSKDFRELPWTSPVFFPRHPGRLTNYYSFMTAKVPADIKGSGARLRAINDLLNGFKNSWKPILGYYGHCSHGSQVNWLGKFINHYRYAPVFITYFPFTNGEEVSLKFAGQEVNDLSFFLKFQGQESLICSVSSFGGKLKIRFVADKQLLSAKDVKDICEMMEAEVSKLMRQ